MRSPKQSQLRCLHNWAFSARQIGHIAYRLTAESLGFDPSKVAASMTENQLKLCNALIAATYNRGCHETREHIYQLQADSAKFRAERAEVARGKLTVIRGGAA